MMVFLIVQTVFLSFKWDSLASQPYFVYSYSMPVKRNPNQTDSRQISIRLPELFMTFLDAEVRIGQHGTSHSEVIRTALARFMDERLDKLEGMDARMQRIEEQNKAARVGKKPTKKKSS